MRKVKVEAHLLEQLRARVERARAAEDAASMNVFVGAVSWLSEEMDRTAEEVPA